MYLSYGDRDFFEHGLLIDAEHSDTEIMAICCEPYPDKEDLFQFGVCTVDITDSWIDRESVMRFIGMSETTFDPVEFAIGCLNYYNWENFGAMNYAYDWTQMDRESIKEHLKHYLIASDNLDICW